MITQLALPFVFQVEALIPCSFCEHATVGCLAPTVVGDKVVEGLVVCDNEGIAVVGLALGDAVGEADGVTDGAKRRNLRWRSSRSERRSNRWDHHEPKIVQI